MTMKIFTACVLLSLSLTEAADVRNNDNNGRIGSLRKTVENKINLFVHKAEEKAEEIMHHAEETVQGFECTIQARDQSTCDNTKDNSGSTCVWCSVSSVGICVTEDIAQQMKTKIPNIDCDDDNRADDDKAPSTDDDKVTPTEDDSAPNDDTVPSDYWNCITKNGTEKACDASGCAWCSTKAGYGICMDKETAKTNSDSDWYTCSSSNNEEDITATNGLALADPTDPTCALATMSGDESSCKKTEDASGNACEWCSFNGFDFCANEEQAQIVEQAGATCNEDKRTSETSIEDPNDLTCIQASIGGDQTLCQETLDSDNKPCEWCSFNGFNFCMNVDQAQIAEGFGADCGDNSVLDVVTTTSTK
jgi:hypothetical protein